jgi:signal transduction histidine kinase
MAAEQSPAIGALVEQLRRLPGVDDVRILHPAIGPTPAPTSGDVEVRDFSAVVPIVTAGGPWGAAELFSDRTPFPPAAIDSGVGLVAVAAAALDCERRCGELQASRIRLIRELDETFDGVERELHDGVQQRLTTTGLELRLIRDALPDGDPTKTALDDLGAQINDMATQVRELSRRTFPAVLADGGLVPALRSLARRSAVPVGLDLSRLRRYPSAVEVTVYRIAAELTERAAEAQAREVSVRIAGSTDAVHLTVTVEPTEQLRSIDPVTQDRVDAVGGTVRVQSVRGRGTTVAAAFPVSTDVHTR